VLAQVWKCKRLEVLDGPLRLLAYQCSRGAANLLSAWRSFTESGHSWSDQRHWQNCWSASWRPNVRLAVVRPWRANRLGYIAPRRWLHIWSRHLWPIHQKEWTQDSCTCALTCHVGKLYYIFLTQSRGTTGLMKSKLSQYFQRQTTVTDAETKQASWK